MHHLKRPFYLLNILKSIDGAPYPSVEAKNLVLDESSEGEPVKEPIQSGKYRKLVFRFLIKFVSTLISEAKVDVDLAIFMVSPDKVHLLGIDAFEGEQEADRLQGMVASINEIPQKYVVEILYIFFLAVFVRSTVKGKETHKISELTVDVSEYFQRGFGLKDHGLADQYLLGYVAQGNDFLCSKVEFNCVRVHEVVGLHQSIQELEGNVKFRVQL